MCCNDCKKLLSSSYSDKLFLQTYRWKGLLNVYSDFSSGPISGPREAEFILKSTKGVHGFYGASSLERLPVEQAITNTVKEYKCISIKRD